MNKLCKQFFCILFACVPILSGCGPAAESSGQPLPTGIQFQLNTDPCRLYYDDVVDLGIAPFNATSASAVVVTDQTVSSRQVANGQPDQNVLTYDSATNTLYAAGVGTATLTIDGIAHKITVSPAPINIFFIGGHSQSAGVGGDPELSVACPAGQVYSTYETYITAKVNQNWGWEKNWSLSQTDTAALSNTGIGRNAAKRPETIDALTAGNTGTYGCGSAIAYRWNQLTGEKVWLINAGHGGAGLDEWWEGAVDYNHTVKLMTNVLTIMKNEIAAGHYDFRRMEFFYFSCANGDQDWDPATYKDAFDSLYNGFKRDIAMDLDGDGNAETIDCIGLVPHWRPAGNAVVDQAFNNGQAQNYHIAASKAYPDVYLASTLCRNYSSISADAIAALYHADKLDYTTQNGTDPNTLIPSTMKGTQGLAVFPDNIHLAQISHNLQGTHVADGLYARLTATGFTTKVTAYKIDGINTIANGDTLKVGTYAQIPLPIVPLDGVWSELTFETTGNVHYDGVFLTTGSSETAALTVKYGSTVVYSITVSVE